MSGKSTSPNILVHSLWSGDARSLDRSVRCSEVSAWCRISRHGLRHCVVRQWKMGDQ